MSATVGEHRAYLGEGPLWHPLLGKLFWFDIIGKKLFCDDGRDWDFNEHVSAAGWLSEDELLIASETRLFRFNLDTRETRSICPLEADDPETRSNDGRADPWGGFWIGTMGKSAEPDRGAIYRYYDGELRQMFAPVTVSNAICFAPNRACAYFADTRKRRILRYPLSPITGWPDGAPTTFVDLNGTLENPDGAITCADGSLLIALWGSGCIAHFCTEGEEITRFPFPTAQITCPALGGPGLSTLFATSAQQGLSEAKLAAQPLAGRTFQVETGLKGVAEYQVKL